MRCFLSVFALLTLSGLLRAHTGGEVEVKCPLDGTTFKAWQDFSGTSFGRRLDLKELGPTASPWSLPQCPKCHVPIYQAELATKEKSALQRIVKSAEFLHAVESGSSYAALAVIREKTNLEPFRIAESYLQASWQLEGRDTYAEIAKAAIRWFDEAAPTLKGPDHRDRYAVSLYAPIELLRRTGQFAAAAERLKAFPPDLAPAGKWFAMALPRQKILIAAQDRGTDEANAWEVINNDRSISDARKHAVTATTPAETALLADGLCIGKSCFIHALSNGVAKIKITLDVASGRFGPNEDRGKTHISPGTELVDDTWESEGTFSLRRPDAFGGRAIVFDEAGYAAAQH